MEASSKVRETDEENPEEEGDVIDSLRFQRSRRLTKTGKAPFLADEKNIINCEMAKTALLLPFQVCNLNSCSRTQKKSSGLHQPLLNLKFLLTKFVNVELPMI